MRRQSPDVVRCPGTSYSDRAQSAKMRDRAHRQKGPLASLKNAHEMTPPLPVPAPLPCVCMCASVGVCTRVCMCVCACVRVRMCARMYACACVTACVHTRVLWICIYVCVHARVRVHVCVCARETSSPEGKCWREQCSLGERAFGAGRLSLLAAS